MQSSTSSRTPANYRWSLEPAKQACKEHRRSSPKTSTYAGDATAETEIGPLNKGKNHQMLKFAAFNG